MYFYVLRVPFIEIQAAFEFSPNSVELYRILEFYLQILAEFYRFSNSTFKFWPNSAEFQILPSEFWVKLRAPFSTGKAGLSFSLTHRDRVADGLHCHIMNVTAL